MAVRILHAADFHMDSPFGALPPEKAVQRRQEQRELLRNIAELCEHGKVQILLLSGDLFDSGASYWETQETLLSVLSGISAKIFIAPGNHDYFSQKSPYAFLDFPENVHIFKTPSCRCVELPELGCRVWGAGFTTGRCEPILRGFSTGKSEFIDIMTLHGDLSGGVYNPITEEEIAASGLDYLALGHTHSFSGIKKAGGTYYAYPGCPEGRGFDETGPKGVIAGTVGKGECDLQFVPLSGRQYVVIDVDMTGRENAEETVLAACGEGRPRDVARILLKGEFSGEADEEALLNLLRDKYYHVQIKDETIPARGLWEGADEDSLTGLFLTKMRRKYEEAQGEERELILLSVRYGIAALEGREAWRP